MDFDHAVHALVAAEYGIGWARIDAQGAPYAPVFVTPSDMPRGLGAVQWVQWGLKLTGDGRQSGHPFLSPWRALVDGGFTSGNGLCVLGTVGVVATRALGLWQSCQYTLAQIHGI